jgi:hypothetical protein
VTIFTAMKKPLLLLLLLLLLLFLLVPLGHRVFMKSFVSLQFLNPRQSVGLLGRGIIPSHDCCLTKTDINVLSGIRTRGPSVRASENISYLDRAANVAGLIPHTLCFYYIV